MYIYLVCHVIDSGLEKPSNNAFIVLISSVSKDAGHLIGYQLVDDIDVYTKF